MAPAWCHLKERVRRIISMENKVITLAHGNGGKSMHELIERLCVNFSNEILDEMADAAELRMAKNKVAFSTDSYVVKPLFFPGGDIGKLAVFGTVNDVSMKGATPLFISLAFIIEEGLELSILDKIARSIKEASFKAKVKVVTGDIKVVEKNAADRLFINTSGIGIITHSGKSVSSRAKKDDINNNKRLHWRARYGHFECQRKAWLSFEHKK